MLACFHELPDDDGDGQPGDEGDDEPGDGEGGVFQAEAGEEAVDGLVAGIVVVADAFPVGDDLGPVELGGAGHHEESEEVVGDEGADGHAHGFPVAAPEEVEEEHHRGEFDGDGESY